MEKTIRVTGKGRISLRPDTIRLAITLETVRAAYEGALRASADCKAELTASLEAIGFAGADLKTVRFNTEPEYERRQLKNGTWASHLTGYRCSHHMKLEFPENSVRLMQVLGALAASPGTPEFSIEYTVADREAAKNTLLANAVKDSAAKAEVLAKAAGVTLAGIRTIDYSWGELNIVSRPMELASMEMCREITDGPVPLDIEPDDIDLSDTVTVVWELA